MKERRLFYGPIGWVGLVGVIIGAFLLAFSFWFLSATVLKDINYVRTEATVVDFEERLDYIDGAYRRVYTEVLEFKVGGETYRTQNGEYSYEKPENIGSKIYGRLQSRKSAGVLFPFVELFICARFFRFVVRLFSGGGRMPVSR